jgi:drug/metabolite transporter (DMT)-like permease
MSTIPGWLHWREPAISLVLNHTKRDRWGMADVSLVGLTSSQAVDETAARARSRRSDLVNWALLVVPGLIWGASFLFIAEGLEAVAPNGVTFTRIAIGFASVSLFPAARRPIVHGDRLGTGILGVLWLAFPLSMFPFAEQHVSSALTGMLNGATPLFATAVAALIARSFPGTGIMLGLAVGLSGTVVMALPGLGGANGSLQGVLMIVAALSSYGVAINLARPLQQRNGALPIMWRALGVALVLTAPLGLPAVLRAHWSIRPLLALIALGALGTCVAYVVTAIAAGRLGATRAAATTFLIPVVALVLGVVVRGEHISAVSVVGAVICLTGAAIIRQTQARK